MQQPAQLTLKAVLLGMLLAVILAGANAYLGLFAGMTVSASIPAAVISMGLLRLFRNSNILENNIVQTAASAGESVTAGAIFTLPALILLDYWQAFDYYWVCAIAGVGGLLGVLFTVPLRRSLIVEQELPFPEGTATAEVLKVGENPGRGLQALLTGALLGGSIKLLSSGLKVLPGTAQAGAWVGGNTIVYAGMNLSPALVGVGYIVGLNIAVLVLLGGVLAWGIGIPVYSTLYATGDGAAVDAAYTIWSTRIRYVGVGAMLVGGIWALISISGSLRTLLTTGGTRSNPDQAHERDLPMRYVLVATGLLLIPMLLLYRSVLGDTASAATLTLLMCIAGFLFSAVAGYMAGLVGSSNNPVSGMTIATILSASLLLLFIKGPGADAAAAAILIGAVVCCAAAIAGDNMQDLKAGRIVGATPWKQQIMQAVGVLSAALVIAPVLKLLLDAYGIGPATAARPDSLAAPQATLMAAVARGVLGGELPWTMVSVGAGLGSAIIIIDEWLRRSQATFRMPVLAVAIGIYLPLELAVPIALGGFISWWIQQQSTTPPVAGMLLAAGLITGEALLGIFLAIPIVISGDPGVMALGGAGLGAPAGLIAIAAVCFTLVRVAQTKAN